MDKKSKRTDTRGGQKEVTARERKNVVDKKSYALLEKPSVTQDHNTRVTKNSVAQSMGQRGPIYGTEGPNLCCWLIFPIILRG
jgi:hypothetical protein